MNVSDNDLQTPGSPRRFREHRAFLLILFLVLVAINTLAAKFAVFSFGIMPGVSSFYVVVALMIVFTLWFGMWGAIAAYTGCYIGAGIPGGIPPGLNLVWSLADLWQVLIPLLAFRFMKGDVSLKNANDLLVLLAFGILLNNLAGAAWGSAALIMGGLIAPAGAVPVFYGWFIGNVVASTALVPVLLYVITPVLRAHNLVISKYWR
jgi:hypothetical protein